MFGDEHITGEMNVMRDDGASAGRLRGTSPRCVGRVGPSRPAHAGIAYESGDRVLGWWDDRKGDNSELGEPLCWVERVLHCREYAGGWW